MRRWRPTHRLAGEARRRANCRSYANVYQRRGKLRAQPCRRCGSPNAEKRHLDWNRPLLVEWLCRDCRLGLRQPTAGILAASLAWARAVA